MTELTVQFAVRVPDVGASMEQIEEWLKYQLGHNGGCSMSNPLVDEDLEAKFGSICVQPR